MIGQLLDGRYRIVRNLSGGGFGQTYVAEDTKIPGNPSCVVKHLKPTNSDPVYLQIATRLFTGEAETLAKLGNHDRIPRLLAYFTENQEFYLVEEFVAGHPLGREFQPGQRWTERQAIEFLDDVLATLEFVHGNGMIHRDIKPDNIIRREGDRKFALIDFGAIKQMQNQLATQMEPLSPTVAVGTPGYMPTEQAQGRPRPSSDIYALGMIAVQALTGVSPRELREDPNTGEINWQDLTSVSAGLAAVVTKMIAYQFKDRYKTATEAKQALIQACNWALPQPLTPTASMSATEATFPPTEANAPFIPNLETAETVATPPQSTPKSLEYSHEEQTKNNPIHQVPQTLHQPQMLQPAQHFSPAVPNPQLDSQSSVSPPRKNGVAIALWSVGLIAAVGVSALLANRGLPLFTSTPSTPLQTNISSPSPSPTTQPTTDPTPIPTSSTDSAQVTPLTELEAVERVKALVVGKQKLFAPPFDRELLAQLAVGDEYEKRKGSIDWLQKNNAYYNYGEFEIKPLGQFSAQGNQATVEVEISENPTLYVNGQIDRTQSIPSRGRYRCTLQFDRTSWKIANITKI
jgi:serine/threonine protein kinase